MQKRGYFRKLIFSAILVALEIILHRFVGIQMPTYQISFGFVPVAVSAMLFGPVWAAATAIAADILGTIINSTGAYNPMFSINAVLYALIFSWFFYKKEKNVKRIVLCVIVQLIFVAIPLTPLWLYIYLKYFVGSPKAFSVIFASKCIASLIEAPIKIIVLIPICKYLYPQLERITKKN